MLSISDEAAREKSRLVALRLAILTLRLTENWRRPFDDYDSAMILLAIAVINGEKLTRTPLEPEYQNLAKAIPRDRLTSCNINSIAEATGINRETARRKINKLVAAGLVEKADNGLINFAPGFSQRQEPFAIVRTQLETLSRITNELLRDEVLLSD
jgi:hypothetical protein